MILGRFYFEQLETGNLKGEYSNQLSQDNRPENSNFINDNIERENLVNTLFQLGTSPAFLGHYRTSWTDRKTITMNLRIFSKPNSNNQLLLLEWTNDEGEFIFRGEGFLVDGILIGNYWDNDLDGDVSRAINISF